MRRAALFAYALSFALVAVSAERATFPGYFCAFVLLVVPFRSGSPTAEGAAIQTITYLMSGWVNIAFLASMAIRWRSGHGRAFRLLRAITLAMIPFCWLVMVRTHLYPREGHVLWIGAMLLALFSDNLRSRRLSSAGSHT